MSALVLARLQADETPALPSGAISELRRHVGASSAQCLAQTAEVIRLVRLFAAAGVRVIVLKGVVLSQQLYRSLAMRSSGDIDLLPAFGLGLVPLPPWLVRQYPLLRPFGWLVRNARKRAERRAARR